MKKKIVLLGKSASGKDTIRDILVANGLKTAVSYTTRPKRINEIEGLNYHYISLEKFNELEEENFFLESEIFRVVNEEIWKYGRSYQSIAEGEIFIATVSGVSNMINKTNREQFYIIELTCERTQRLKRLLSRGDDIDEMYRRMKTDDTDFGAKRDFEVDEVLDTTELHSYDTHIEKWLTHVSYSESL